MSVRAFAAILAGVLFWGCAGTYERGAALYREGDLRGALELWESIGPEQSGHSQAQQQIQRVGAEFRRLLQRYEKRGRFYEDNGRLAEALLSYRLALKLDPDQPELMRRVQQLVRRLDQERRRERLALQDSLKARDLVAAGRHERALAQLDPFSPSVQFERRRVRAAIDGAVRRHLREAERSLQAGATKRAEQSFQALLELDPGNEEALGWVAEIRRLDEPNPNPSQSPSRSGLGDVPASRFPLNRSDILAQGHLRAGLRAEGEGHLFRALRQYEAALDAKAGYPKARDALERLRAQMQNRIPELESRAKQYFQEEDLLNAVSMWERILLIDPERRSASYNLSRAQRMLTRLEEIQAGAP